MNARLAAFAAAVALTAGALAGCATTPGDISSGTAGELQTTVVAIAESAAAGDAAGALAQLDALQQQLDAAVADGSVSAERAAAIQSRIDLVRADLQPVPAGRRAHDRARPRPPPPSRTAETMTMAAATRTPAPATTTATKKAKARARTTDLPLG